MKTLSHSLAVLVAVTASLALAGWARTGDATASFSGNGPAGFKIEGKTSGVSVADDGKNIAVTVELKELDTGIGLRNDHMRNKYIEVDKNPNATLTIPSGNVKLEDGKTNEGEGKGTFALHGKTKDITFTYKAVCKGGTCDVEGNADINIEDYGIKIPSYLGVTMKPAIKVKANFQMQKK